MSFDARTLPNDLSDTTMGPLLLHKKTATGDDETITFGDKAAKPKCVLKVIHTNKLGASIEVVTDEL